MSREALDRAADFTWRNARLLEQALFALLFAGGPRQHVVTAVVAYRNDDGGFGHALEADLRGPPSQPVHTELALRVLHDADVRDPDLALGACGFLASVAEDDGRVPTVLRSAAAYPRAAHWEVDAWPPDSPNPTAAVAGMLLWQGVDHEWIDRASEWCWQRLEHPLGDAHEIVAALTFLDHVPDRSRALAVAPDVAMQAYDADWFTDRVGATTYGLTPLDLAPAPDSVGRPAFEDAVIDAHLDDLGSRQEADGGWPIFFDPPSPAAVLEWRGRWTLDALATLRAYGRL